MAEEKKAFPEKLMTCWHPVAYSDELTEKPYGTFLLNQAVVVWRDSKGAVHAMRDLCIHRGTALSLGWVKDDCLVCPYHAWEYNKKGKCVKIPQAPDSPIPAKTKTDVYSCQERYGIIWVALKTPLYPLPEIPQFEQKGWKFVPTGPFEWKSDASRQEVPHCKVETKGHILTYDIVRPESINSKAFPIFGNEEKNSPVRRSQYELHLPYTIALKIGWGGEKGMVYLFASQPIAANKCRGYCVIGRNYDLDIPDKTYQDFEEVIFGQDRRIVESQRPQQVPFDFTEELHLKFDAVAMNYRKAMKKEGLEY